MKVRQAEIRLTDFHRPSGVVVRANRVGAPLIGARFRARDGRPGAMAWTHSLVDDLVEHAPPEHRKSLLSSVRLHREIAAAAREAGL